MRCETTTTAPPSRWKSGTSTRCKKTKTTTATATTTTTRKVTITKVFRNVSKERYFSSSVGDEVEISVLPAGSPCGDDDVDPVMILDEVRAARDGQNEMVGLSAR